MSRHLEIPTQPIGVGDKSIAELLEEMRWIGFQGRRLGESVEVWIDMLRERGICIFLGLAGAMVPAGMRRIISFLIRSRMVDCLVTTGANIFHDMHEALGRRHYLGSEEVSDAELLEHGVDRIHDIFASETEFRELDRRIASFAARLDSDRSYTSREVSYLLGKMISESGGEDESILVSAYHAKVPVYVPALADSSVGIALSLAKKASHAVHVDHIQDVEEMASIVEAAWKTGVVYIGGGVPKNFIQQTEITVSLSGRGKEGHEYAIQYTTDSPVWGGLSGCTFSEAISWGKVSPKARKVQVFVDATIALPIVAHALYQRAGEVRRAHTPRFDLSAQKLSVHI